MVIIIITVLLLLLLFSISISIIIIQAFPFAQGLPNILIQYICIDVIVIVSTIIIM